MIRKATYTDLSAILDIMDAARLFMRSHGNPSQWCNGYPPQEKIMEDIRNGEFFVEECKGKVAGCFAFIIGPESTYATIKGEWKSEDPYGTIHRLASDGTEKGFADRCISFCKARIPHLRADTHQDNQIMQKALLRNGFQYCGIINVANGSERLAYELID